MNPQSLNSSSNDHTLLPEIFNDYPTSDPFANHSFLDPFPTNPSNSDAIPSNVNPEGDRSDFSDSMLKYINQVLMEEDMDPKPCMFPDPLALQATEQSLYEEVIGGKQNPLSYVHESPDAYCSSSSSTCPSFDSWPPNDDFMGHRSSVLQNPTHENFVFQSTSKSRSQLTGDGYGNENPSVSSYASELTVPDVLSESELLFLFNRGVDEGSKFLPKGQLISIESKKPDVRAMRTAKNVGVEMGRDQSEHFPADFRRKKNHQREDIGLEDGRSNKQSAIYWEDEEGELSEILDNVFISKEEGPTAVECDDDQVGQNQGNKKEVVDLRALLISCAQAVSVDDRGTVIELLKQIRRHSSQFGDGMQRLAHCFANALEARLAGIGSEVYIALSSKRVSTADMLKIYLAYQSVVPYMKNAMIFANHMILKYAEKAETLHVIDFGILNGFQWPALIHCLSRRAGGPPKLRITGIDLPLSGFRPEEKVQETGVRLAKYCRRFNVPLEYNGIAKKWETIQLEDLKVQRNEVLAVNSVCRLKNLLDEADLINSPKEAVLNLIRKTNPDVFVQCIVNASYHATSFVSRFREALFYFSSFFDLLDTTFPREDQMRLGFEREFIGREAMNILACEGYERIVRPETYKQWQIRNTRTGFRQLPLDLEVMNKLREKVKLGYNPDFLIDEDGCWMLQGWKGKILHASTCWVPCRT